ncbi:MULTISPECIES: septal ring lytic transglycosylase RlpA family protein [unclassified Nostoc]|uniref:septal ring lytic transglycosylase RlpA family protein n=1 Tax=unclassified Nostoc TaxID=2593658 RepID=UPI002AD57709|nr:MULTISPECIES: septal ring lytic transglycosylase RlpA family protein [unclassified Nostoc]MDZ8121711.1 septal ring lytic transglycosylase RlpA family protein [Nostoc sp. CmiVER01]MDZ8225971.1 septal ring lytic transglycosylase RlpA family protein [Nostoc sp. ChiVER01]
MNQRHLWIIVALSMAALGIPSVGCTQTTKGNALASQNSPAPDVVKVGEYQSTAGKQTLDAVITEIHPHNVGGRKAATLFIRNIPVLTFLSSVSNTNPETKKVGAIGNSGGVQKYALIASNSSKELDTGSLTDVSNQISSADNDPVQIAGVIAAKINQLNRENVDGSKITVSWKAGEKSTDNQAQNKSAPVQPNGDYVIKVNGEELVEINEGTRLADTTNNLAQDALQATNRLRRLLGNASPLKEIANLPPVRLPASIQKLPQEAVGIVRATLRGMASYYGYDGSGNRTASGQRFNPEGMTAAHRSLPFGTKVRVTNTRNGRSVVVRINDRGPFIRGRVIDLSAGAARVLGMMGSGVAPVHIEVLGSRE